MERTRKTWGEKVNIFKNDTCETSVLYLKPNQRCSWHTHQTKFNLFYVLKGELVMKLEDGLSQVLPGQIFTTRPGEFHEFQTRDLDTICIEVMYVQYDSEDIQRKIIGGAMPKKVDLDFLFNCQSCGHEWREKNPQTENCPNCDASLVKHEQPREASI